MRNLFLALVLANLGFAAWHAWLGSTAKAPPPSASGESRLTLVKEVESSDAEFAPAGSGNVESAPAGSGAAAAVPANESGATAERGGGAGRAPAGPADGASASAKSRASRESETIKAAVTAAEAASAAAASNGSPARTDAAADAGERCVSVGPFLDLGQATTASAKLRTAGYEPTQRAGEGEVWVGYWVYLDAIPSQEEA
ncbi:MAG TPA: hypothetical protein VFV10_05480, partial [Gammaproteobacteria bacterium]|nr:hypothetical protein [Gammaproteobacteria bacterium]